jgi:hypothetical protein
MITELIGVNVCTERWINAHEGWIYAQAVRLPGRLQLKAAKAEVRSVGVTW